VASKNYRVLVYLWSIILFSCVCVGNANSAYLSLALVSATCFKLFCSGLAYLLWYKALEDVSATKAGVFLFLLPVVSVSIAHFVLAGLWAFSSL
jgi:drug/metabolite transporter (DMT)-like permease